MELTIVKVGGKIVETPGSLQVLLRQSRELAELTQHYYERSYYRNAKYTL